MSYVLVITGSRYADSKKYPRQAARRAEKTVKTELDEFCYANGDPDFFFHGNALGVDRFGRDYMRARIGTDRVIDVPADWKRHGLGAGPIRNRQMLNMAEAKAKLLGLELKVIGFLETFSVGTKDCLNEATEREYDVTEVKLGDLKGDIEREAATQQVFLGGRLL